MDRSLASDQAIQNRNRALGQLLIIALLLGGAYLGWQMYSSQAATTVGLASVANGFTCGTSQVQDADSNTYDTVQIGTQCWMAQNLNVGTRINISTTQTDNATIEKWCYSDTDANCDSNNNPNNPDGGLYQWDEAMQYSTAEGAQGICPAGWHIPTHDEFTTLERAVCTSGSCDTDFPYDMTTTGYRGTDEGTKLKPNGSSGFEGNLAGEGSSGSFYGRGTDGFFWSSSESGTVAWLRYFGSGDAQVLRNAYDQANGRSVRCLKDAPEVTIATTPTLSSEDSLNQGLIGHWTFDGMDVDWASSTAEISDVTGSGRNGDATTTVTMNSIVPGKLGQAINFDGNSGFIEISDDDAFSFTAGGGDDLPFSISVWAKVSAQQGDAFNNQKLVSKQNGSSVEWELGHSIGGNLQFRVFDSDIDWIGRGYSASTFSVHDDEWIHIVGTYDGSNATTGIKVYIDSTRVDDADTVSTVYDGTSNTNAPVNISFDGALQAVYGNLDDVRIYNRELTVEEVQRLYHMGEGTKTHNTLSIPNLEQGLVGHWTFDGVDVDWASSTAEVSDVSGYGHTANAINGMNADSAAAGVLGQGLDFNYADQEYLLVASTSELSMNSNMTLSVWANPVDIPASLQGILNKGGGLNAQYRMIIVNNDFYFSIGDGSTYVSWNTPLAGWEEWHHYVCMTDTSDMWCYIDGELAGAPVSRSTIGTTFTGDETLILGSRDTGQFHFDGRLDDMRIYNRVLSADEALQLYNLGR